MPCTPPEGVSYTLVTLAVTLCLCVAMVMLVLLGTRRGARRLARGGEAKLRGNVVDGSVFSLLALLVAFSFYGAVGRFDEHRKLVGAEANVLDGVYHALDLLPPAQRAPLKAKMRDYVQSRIDVYAAAVDPRSEAAARSRVLREQVWSGAVAACEAVACPAATVSLIMNGIDRMLDYPTEQAVMHRMHPPWVVFGMMFAMALLCAYFIGLDLAGAKDRSWLYILAYPVTLSAIVWVTLDLEIPRQGVVRLDEMTDLLVQLRDEMGR